MQKELLVNSICADGTTLARIRGDRNAPSVQLSPEFLGGEVLPKDSLIAIEGRLVYSDTGKYLIPRDCKLLGVQRSQKSLLAGKVYGEDAAPHPADTISDSEAPF